MGGFRAPRGSFLIPFLRDFRRFWGVPPSPIYTPLYPVYPPFCPKNRKNPKFHFVPTGRVIKYPRKCTPPGGPGPPPGGPPGGSPRPRSVYPPGGLVDGWGYPYTPTVVFPQPLFPRDVRCGLFRTQTSLSTRFDQRQVLTHTLTRDWVPSSYQSLRPRHLGRSRGLSHFAPTGWGISSLAGAFPSGGFSPSVYPREWFSPAFGFTLSGVGRVPSP